MILVKIPRLGQTMQEGTITTWHKDEGDYVEKGEILFEVESDKSNMEIEAQDSGYLKKIILEEYTTAPVGEIAAVLGGKEEEINWEEIKEKSDMIEEIEKANTETKKGDKPLEEPEEEKTEKKKKTIKALPRVRKLAEEEEISLQKIEGSGPKGAIMEEDVKKFIDEKEEQGPISIKKKIPLTSTRKAMSKNISKSWEEIPHFTQRITVRADKLLKLKEEKDISLNALLIKALASAIKDNELVNSKLDGDEIKVYEDINIGIAVAKDEELFVPVIKRVQDKSAKEINKEIKDYADKDKFTQEDLGGGTITFSNLGYYGIESGTSIISPSQSCLVFAGKIEKEVKVDEEDKLEIVPVFQFSITYDHRFISGMTAAQFTSGLKDKVENLN